MSKPAFTLPAPIATPAADLRVIAHWLPRFAEIQHAFTRSNNGQFNSRKACNFLTREWAKVEGCFRRVGEIPPEMPTSTPTEAHFRNEVNRLIRVCLDAIERWEPEGGTSKPVVRGASEVAESAARTTTAHATSSQRSGRRKMTEKQDARIWDAWQSGQHADFADLANNLKMSRKEVERTIDRERKRRKNTDG